jgi:Flp pilus assembly pilin Flp
MKRALVAIGRFAKSTEGQDLLEYGLLVALIALVAFAGVSTLGTTIYNVFWSSIGQAI